MTLGLGCVAGLGLLELIVRLFLPYNTPDTVRRHSLQYLPSAFARHRLAPDQTLTTAGAWGRRPGGGEDDRAFRINERGYRGAPIETPKPPGTVRIVVLGGSSVFDINASEGHDWPHLAQEMLRTMGHPGVEVINAGVPGHATGDSLGRLYSQIWMYEPDYVLVYGAWNDMKYMGALDPGHPLIEVVPPYDPRADPFQNYRGLLDRVLCHSQIYVKLRNRHFLRRLEPGIEGARGAVPAQSSPVAWGLRQYRLNLDLLVDGSRDIGAIPLLITEATLVAPGNGPGEKARIHYEYQSMDHDALIGAFQDLYRAVREVGRDKNVAVLDLAARLNGRPELFEDQVHTTPLGSRTIAAEVAEFLNKVMDRNAP